MLSRLWLLFAQAVTIGLALLFIVATLQPQWLRGGTAIAPPPAPQVTIQQAAPPPEAPAAVQMKSYAEAARRAMPAVVSVYTTKEIRRSPALEDPIFDRFFGDRPPGRGERVAGLGSGVIAAAEGYVLTNHHVVQAADEIAVGLADGRKVAATLVGADPETDVAVLRIEARDLPVITLGSSDALNVGDVVLAIGNPFDVGQTVTMGIVSAVGRNNLGINRYENFIQTDAAINQGNSGGALIDTAGNLVGINTAIYSRSGGSIGIGFAIPTALVTEVMRDLIAKGRVTRGYFGIEPVDITPELVAALKLRRQQGVVVRGVQRNAPAGSAGVEPGDVLLTINDTPVRDTPGMLQQIAQLAPGSVARVRVERDGRQLDLNVTVGERPVPPERR
jgi:Do/DeqQ family serine protease